MITTGATAMRGYLVAIFLSAIFLYYVLHCISWGTSVYWAHPVEMQQRKRGQPCREKPAFASLLRFHEFHPFLCASDFKKIASLYGGDKFSLPYGIKASEEPFRLALSALQSCDLFDEFDTNANTRRQELLPSHWHFTYVMKFILLVSNTTFLTSRAPCTTMGIPPCL
uniref:ST3 beta-galactoside alpha-2,3-sialyltransferase 6 n=1 Tax=Equus asinus TaxID=9793 RepID=A0A9L0JT97_EQUAS